MLLSKSAMKTNTACCNKIVKGGQRVSGQVYSFFFNAVQTSSLENWDVVIKIPLDATVLGTKSLRGLQSYKAGQPPQISGTVFQLVDFFLRQACHFADKAQICLFPQHI